jgi:hypothetical protein
MDYFKTEKTGFDFLHASYVVLVSVTHVLLDMFTSWGHKFMAFRLSVCTKKQSCSRSALHYSACHCIDNVWKTKDAALQKYITKGCPFVVSFICFYLVQNYILCNLKSIE